MFSSWRSRQRNSTLAVESGGVELLLNSLFLFIWRPCELWLSRLPSSQLLLEAMSQLCGPPVVNKWQAKLILAFTMHATLLLFSFSSTSDLLNGFFFFSIVFQSYLKSCYGPRQDKWYTTLRPVWLPNWWVDTDLSETIGTLGLSVGLIDNWCIASAVVRIT